MAELPVRERIVREARGLLRQGPDGRGLSMDRLARAAGVSRATLYRYFPSKAALLEELAPGDGAALADTRAKILEAALAVFCERGIHAATLPEVAKQAGLSLSGLHWHFRNKDELVAGLAEYLPLLPTIAAEAALAGSADLELQLQRIAQVALGAMRRYRGLLRLAICEATQYPDVARLAATHTIGRGLPLLAQVFEEHARRGDLRPGPARVRAQGFMSMLLMLAILRPVFGHLWEADDVECAREYVQILLRGVLAEPDGPPTADRRPQEIHLTGGRGEGATGGPGERSVTADREGWGDRRAHGLKDEAATEGARGVPPTDAPSGAAARRRVQPIPLDDADG